MKHAPKPTETMIKCAQAVVMAQAYTETIRPVVKAYEKEILERLQIKDERNGLIITTSEFMYLASDEDFNRFEVERRAACEKSGLKVDSPEYCPLLVAESLQRQAERNFVDCMQPITQMTAEKIISSAHGLENFKKVLHLSLSYVVPFIDKSKILQL